jgi:cytochrome c-type biogenesis protein
MLALVVFIAGILTFLAPCTLPVLPAYLAFSAQQSKTSTLLRTLSFGAGVLLVFLIFGLLAGSLGGLLATYKRQIAIISGIIFIVLGMLVLTGRGIPGITINTQPSRSIPGSFLFGVIFALSWSGCIGPVLGFVLVLAANTQTALSGAALLAVYAIGLLLPLIIVSLWIDKLPRDGKFWRFMKGTVVKVSKWEFQSTELITALMLIVLGVLFIFGVDKLLSTSPLITTIFRVEERIAASLGIILG